MENKEKDIELTTTIAKPFAEFVRWEQSTVIYWQEISKYILIAHFRNKIET